MPTSGGDGTTKAPPKRAPRPRNQNGQKMGAKGSRTRQKLIDATIALLETVGLRDVTVFEVAKLAGTSPATFYVYFDGVPEVVLAALETAEQVTPAMLAILDRDFSGDAGFALAREFVESYVAQWQKHRTVFRVRNMAGEEGDTRFLAERQKRALPLIDALESKIALAGNGTHGGPRAVAATLLIMLERLGAVAPIPHGDERVSGHNLILAAAGFLHFALVPGDRGQA